MKKKSLALVIAPVIFLLTSIVAHQSCRKQSSRIIEVKEITESDAKEIFFKARTELQRKFKSEYGEISPYWEKSKIVKLSSQNTAIYTPLAFNKETGKYLQIICLKDKGKLRSLITEMKPDPDYYEKLGFQDYYSTLTGKLLFYSVTGNFIKGYNMKRGLSQGRYFPKDELGNLSVLNRSSGTGIQGMKNLTEDDPCEGNWGNFGCQELTSVVVEATPISGGDVVFISMPIDLYYSSPTGGVYGGYNWVPVSVPTSADMVNLALSIGKPCPASFRFKNLTSTMRRAKVWGLYYEVYEYPTNELLATLTFGLQIDIPSDIIAAPNWTRDNLLSEFGSKLNASDLVLYTDSEGIEHLRISQAAQTLIAVEAVHETNLQVKTSEMIDEIVTVGSSYFKQQYKEILLNKLFGYIGGCRVQTLNSNVSGTTPYRSESIFGC